MLLQNQFQSIGPRPLVKKYKKVIDKKTKKFFFSLMGTAKNYLSFDDRRQQQYDFYLGGTDSCQGQL